MRAVSLSAIILVLCQMEQSIWGGIMESCKYAKRSAIMWLNKVDFSSDRWWETEEYKIAKAYEEVYISIRNELREQKGRPFIIQKSLKATKKH